MGDTENCTVDCSFAAAADFVYFVVKYDGLWALFENTDGDQNAEYKLGADNFGTSNITFLTPIPGAVWLFGTGLLGLLGIGYTRRRQATA